MNPTASPDPRRWTAFLLQAAICLVTFGAGWHWAPEMTAAFVSHPKTVTPASNISPVIHFTGNLAQAKAALAKVPQPVSGDDWSEDNHAMLDFVAGLDADTVKGLLDDMAANPKGDHSGMTELIDRWSELDPQAAFAWTQNLHDPAIKNTYVEQAFKNWAEQSPADAFAALRALPASEQSGLLPPPQVSQYSPAINLYADLFNTWAKNDPTAAVAAAMNLPGSKLRNDSLTAIAREWADEDPASAVAWAANALPAGSARDGALGAAISIMSVQDPQAAADFATSLPNNSARDDFLKNIADNWALKDPIAALQWAEQSLTGTAHDVAVNAAFETMSRLDPASAAAYLAQNSDPSLNDYIHTFEVANAWANQDSQAALAWALTLPATTGGSQNPATSLREQVLFNVLATWSDTNPVGAAAYVQTLSTDPQFGKLASWVAEKWGDTDPRAALAWAQSLPPGDAQNTVVTAAVTQLVNLDPQTALNDAQQLTGDNRDKAISGVFSRWANQQPNQAAAALTSLPTGDNLNAATADVARSWLEQDPAAASQWINTLTPGAARDGAVDAIVTTVGKNDPAAAFNWAVTIGDPTSRDTQVVDLATKWAAKDSAAAATAAQNALNNLSGLTDTQRASLQKIASPAPTP